MKKTLREIADLLEGDIVGDANTVITGIAAIQNAQEGDLTFLEDKKFASFVKITKASALIAADAPSGFSGPIIRVKHPSRSFSRLIGLFHPPASRKPGVDTTAIIGKDVVLGEDVSVGAYVVIEEGARVGDGSVLYPFVFIGKGTSLGKQCIVYSHVSIREDLVIGNEVIVHAGSVIGSDGFGYDTIDGQHHKIPHVGSVIIEDCVEVGANVTIDRARLDNTIIGKGTKIDNLVQIAHNVVMGEHCLIIAQAGMAGSAALGRNVILAGQAGVTGHIKLGDHVVVAAKAGVTKSVKDAMVVSGFPARDHKEQQQIQACVVRLPHLFEQLQELKARLEQLENDKGTE